MTKKKILFVINSMGCGGAEKSLVSMLSLFDFTKYEVDLQMFNPGGMFMPLLPEEVNILPELPYISFCRKGGYSLRYHLIRLRTSLGIRLHPKCNGKSLHDAQAYWKFASGAFAQLTKTYDVAFAWGQGNPTHFVAEKVVAKKKLAVVNVNYEASGHNKWFDNLYYYKFDTIVLVSETLRDLMKKVYPELQERMVTVYDIRNQSLIEKMADAYIPYERQANIPIFVTVGRMVWQKGYDLALETGKMLKAGGVCFQWYFVGDGPERAKIQQLIIENDLSDVIFSVGAKENPYPYMKHADIYVQTSRFEGFCLTLCEARGLHIPPISTNFDVVYDQIRDGENGLIVGMTPEAIADGIERILHDTALRRRIVENLKAERIGNENEIEKIYQFIWE